MGVSNRLTSLAINQLTQLNFYQIILNAINHQASSGF